MIPMLVIPANAGIQYLIRSDLQTCRSYAAIGIVSVFPLQPATFLLFTQAPLKFRILVFIKFTPCRTGCVIWLFRIANFFNNPMKSSICINSRRAAFFAVVLILSVIAATNGFAQPGQSSAISTSRSNTNHNMVLHPTGGGPNVTAPIDSNGNFTTPMLHKGTYTVTVVPVTPQGDSRVNSELEQADITPSGAAMSKKADSTMIPHPPKKQGAASVNNTSKSNVKYSGLALNPGHVSFTGTKGATIFVGGTPATGRISLSDANPVTINVSTPVSVSGTVSN